ncbi:uncharacterized protein VTP21DRAFT_3512 [Calcarisporiella thermophila]|uniref:uncharacterized protein n=1 Tax=Calcarisporiella thermophila TaxID=911321 RepID=UPI00374239EE
MTEFHVRSLEYYRSREEAARCFEDDLEFCPSLTPDEFAQLRRQLSERVQSLTPLTSPTISASTYSTPRSSPRKAIPIVDPNNRTPVTLPPPPSKQAASSYYLGPNTNSVHISVR